MQGAKSDWGHGALSSTSDETCGCLLWLLKRSPWCADRGMGTRRSREDVTSRCRHHRRTSTTTHSRKTPGTSAVRWAAPQGIGPKGSDGERGAKMKPYHHTLALVAVGWYLALVAVGWYLMVPPSPPVLLERHCGSGPSSGPSIPWASVNMS